MIVDEIVRRLRSDEKLPSRRRAELEEQLYDLTDDPDGKRGIKGGVPEYLRVRYDLPFYDVRSRHTLLLAGGVAESLWQAIDEHEMLPSTACTLLREARRRSDLSGQSLEVEVENGLDAWLDRAVVRTNKDTGRRHRSRMPNRAPPSPREALDQIRACATAYTERVGVTLDRHTRKRIVSDLMSEVDALLAGLLLRVKREEARARTQQAPPAMPRHELVDACELLGIPHPTPSRPAIDMGEAKKRYRIIVAQTHPDRTRDDASRPAFEAAVKAMDVIKRYVEEQGSSRVNSTSSEEKTNGAQG